MDRRQTDKILQLMSIMVSSYPSPTSQDSTGAIQGYMMAIEGCSFRAVDRVLTDIIKGKQASFDNKFAPTSGQLGEMCRRTDDDIRRIEEPKRTPEHGILRVNFGGPDIDTSKMPLKQLDQLLATNGHSRDLQIGSVVGDLVQQRRPPSVDHPNGF